MSLPSKICPQCKRVTPLSAAFCEGCGRQFQTTAPDQPPPDRTIMVLPVATAPPRPSETIQLPAGMHSPVGPILLAVFLTWWAGALGNRQTTKGLVLLGGTAVLMIITVGLAFIPLWALGIVDTVLIAYRLNRGEPVGPWQFF